MSGFNVGRVNPGLVKSINNLPEGNSRDRIELMYREPTAMDDSGYDNPGFDNTDMFDARGGGSVPGSPTAQDQLEAEAESVRKSSFPGAPGGLPYIAKSHTDDYEEHGPVKAAKKTARFDVPVKDAELEKRPMILDTHEDRIRQWDVFRKMPVIVDMSFTEWFLETSKKGFKVLTIVVCFVVILFGSILMKSTLLLAAANTNANLTLVCRDYNLTDENQLYTRCVHVADWWEPEPPPAPGTQEPPAFTWPDVTLFNNYDSGEVGLMQQGVGVDNFAMDFSGTQVTDDGYPDCLESGLNRWAIPLQDEPYYSSTCDALAIRWVWCITMILITPQVLIFLRCVWYVCFKTKVSPPTPVLVFSLIMEILHTAGLTLFAYRVLPQLHSSAHGAALMAGFSFIPALLKVFCRPKKEIYRPFKMLLDIFCIVVQLTAMLAWPMMALMRDDEKWDVNSELMWAIPVSLFLISFGWWENYITGEILLPGPLKYFLLRMKKGARRSKTKLYLRLSFLKIGLILAMMTGWMCLDERYDWQSMWDWSSDHCAAQGTIGFKELPQAENDWLWVWITNGLVGIPVYFCARSAIKVLIQVSAYAVPLSFVTPLLMVMLLGMCEAWNADSCQFSGWGPPAYMFWGCQDKDELLEAANKQMLWLVILWWASQFWISSHIWRPKNERLAKTDKLFTSPLYESLSVEQWYLHNRTKEERTLRNAQSNFYRSGVSPEPDMDDLDWFEEREKDKPTVQKLSEKTPMIYFCATLWHETDQEIVTILKSIFRSDIDQYARKMVKDKFGVNDPDYYNFEAHFFFDDAMEGYSPEESEYKVNHFVKNLVAQVNVAAKEIHKVDIAIPPPNKFPTPYGGRLEWTLPGGNKMTAHLKDKQKIRHKKRWSQVMYMYYFLGMKLWMTDAKTRRKQLRAENTFILALDGDVDFKPDALQMLVDLMKKDPKVGAACGRIHPIGNGPMIWYQQFEYALGHWMQKSTEHVLGCVLCSPGCFSLFRGSALMEDNVMNMYTSEPKEAIHYVQYDQGEDRWLCTLLLQAGYRVEYSAAADALTFAPEGFNEFYNQRRRWGPSTMANVLDLLMSWRTTVKANENISFIYIMYQVALFISSFVGTGTIFLMIVESLRVALNYQIGAWESLGLNLIPVVIFTFVCFNTKSHTQLKVAQILTVMYALLQMLVLVGIIVQIGEEGICSPSGVFFFAVAAIFVIAAILHPQEFTCLFMGMIYFVAIPSMYMLLMMYSLTNLHDISWGTREVVKTKTELEKEKEEEAIRKAEEEQEKAEKTTGIEKFFKEVTGEETGFTIGIDHIFRWVCCPRPAPPPDDTKLNLLLARLDKMESVMTKVDKKMGRQKVAFNENVQIQEADLSAPIAPKKKGKKGGKKEKRIVRNDLVNPYWIEDRELGIGPVGILPQSEVIFFQDLIEAYLAPIEKDKVKEERISMELKDLRNKVSFSFFLLNAIFVVAVFTLQRNVDKIHIDWPCGKGDNLMLEPIGFMFVGFFGIIMLVQFFGMLVHRMTTFLHLVSMTHLRAKTSDGVMETLTLVKQMLDQHEDDDDEDNASVVSSVATSVGVAGDEDKKRTRRKTISKLERSQKKKSVHDRLNLAFEDNYEKLQEQLANADRETSPEEVTKKLFKGDRKQRQSVAGIKMLKERRESRMHHRSSTVINNNLQRQSVNSDNMDDVILRAHERGPNQTGNTNMKARMKGKRGAADYLAAAGAAEEGRGGRVAVSPKNNPPPLKNFFNGENQR